MHWNVQNWTLPVYTYIYNTSRVRWHLTFECRAVVHLLKVEGISIFLLTQSLTTTIYICETRALITPRSCLSIFFFFHKGAPTSNISVQSCWSLGWLTCCEISDRTCVYLLYTFYAPNLLLFFKHLSDAVSASISQSLKLSLKINENCFFFGNLEVFFNWSIIYLKL